MRRKSCLRLISSICSVILILDWMSANSIAQSDAVLEQSVSKQDMTGISWPIALFTAVSKEDSEKVQELVSSPDFDDYVNAKDPRGYTALYWASLHGNAEIAKILLDAGGVDPDFPSLHGETPLHTAARLGYLDVVNVLLDNGATTNVKNQFGQTPLHYASGPVLWDLSSDPLGVVQKLIESDAEIVDEIDKYGQTPLFVAAKNGQTEIVKSLLTYNSDVVNKPNQIGITPLFAAVESGNVETVKELVKAGANVTLENELGETPKQAALEMDYVEIFQTLQAAGIQVE